MKIKVIFALKAEAKSETLLELAKWVVEMGFITRN